MHVIINQTQSFRRNQKKLKSLFSRNKQRSKDIKHFTTASEIKSYQGHLQKHKPQEMIIQYACNKLISGSLNIRLSAAKTRFTPSKFRMLQVMHCVVLVTLRERDKKKENHCSSRLSKSRFTLSQAYESCLACQRLFLTGNLLAHTPQKNRLSTLTVFVRILLIDRPKILRYHKMLN